MAGFPSCSQCSQTEKWVFRSCEASLSLWMAGGGCCWMEVRVQEGLRVSQ